MLAATLILPFSPLKRVYTRFAAMCLFVLSCVNSRWSTWVVRVSALQKIFKPHSQISRLGMWTICFPIITSNQIKSSCSPSGISIHCTITRQDKINDIQKYDITEQDKNIQETKSDRKRTN